MSRKLSPGGKCVGYARVSTTARDLKLQVRALNAAVAKDERQRIIKSSLEGRAIAKANGVKMGRKPEFTEHQRQCARGSVAAGEKAAVIAKDLKVHNSTFARLV